MASYPRASALHAYPGIYLICRDRAIGHDWDLLIPWNTDRRSLRGGHEISRTHRCARCTGQRIETFEQTGDGLLHKKQPRYIMPKDYAWPTTDYGPLSAAEVYTEQYRRDRAQR